MPDAPSIPDLEHPPEVIQGPGGGPAFPTGGGIGPETKEGYEEASDLANYAAAGYAVGAGAIMLGGPQMGPGAAFMAFFSGVFWMLAQALSDIAEDPPRTFRQIVAISPRRCTPPGVSTAKYRKLGIAAQQAFFATVTARGYLEALEKLAGASANRDLSWAVTHKGVLMQYHQALLRDLATTAAGLKAAARSLDSDLAAVRLSPENARGFAKWIAAPKTMTTLKSQFLKAGLTQLEFRAASKQWKRGISVPTRSITLQRAMSDSADRLHATVRRLNKLGLK